jgi:hypothetical protein
MNILDFALNALDTGSCIKVFPYKQKYNNCKEHTGVQRTRGTKARSCIDVIHTSTGCSDCKRQVGVERKAGRRKRFHLAIRREQIYAIEAKGAALRISRTF